MASTVPTLTPIKMLGNLTENWDFFKQMWSNYEIASGLIKKSAEVRKATLKVVMGSASTIEFTDEQQNSSTAVIYHLNDYFVLKTNITRNDSNLILASNLQTSQLMNMSLT